MLLLLLQVDSVGGIYYTLDYQVRNFHIMYHLDKLLLARTVVLTLIRRGEGGANMPQRFLNAYSSGTETLARPFSGRVPSYFPLFMA